MGGKSNHLEINIKQKSGQSGRSFFVILIIFAGIIEIIFIGLAIQEVPEVPEDPIQVMPAALY